MSIYPDSLKKSVIEPVVKTGDPLNKVILQLRTW